MCWINFLPHKPFRKYFKSSIFLLHPCLLARTLLHFLCWRIAAFLDVLSPPIDQWDSGTPLAEITASPACVEKKNKKREKQNGDPLIVKWLHSTTRFQKHYREHLNTLHGKSQFQIKLDSTILDRLSSGAVLVHFVHVVHFIESILAACSISTRTSSAVTR